MAVTKTYLYKQAIHFAKHEKKSYHNLLINLNNRVREVDGIKQDGLGAELESTSLLPMNIKSDNNCHFLSLSELAPGRTAHLSMSGCDPGALL